MSFNNRTSESSSSAYQWKACLILIIVFTLTGCGTGEGETSLSAQIVDQPNGGEYVRTLDASIRFNRRFEDNSGFLESSANPRDIDAEIQWLIESQDGPVVIESGRVTVKSDSETYRSSISSGSGNVLRGTFYVRVNWSDDTGESRITSRRVICTNPPSQATSGHTSKIE